MVNETLSFEEQDLEILTLPTLRRMRHHVEPHHALLSACVPGGFLEGVFPNSPSCFIRGAPQQERPGFSLSVNTAQHNLLECGNKNRTRLRSRAVKRSGDLVPFPA